VNEVGLNGKDVLFVIIAAQMIEESEEIVGVLTAQFMRTEDCGDRGLFGNHAPPYVMYILTLGVKETCRRRGLATDLLAACVQHAMDNPLCGAVSTAIASRRTG
jgi:ribosomal protein S18 acetylase RimI-like enzyme